MLEASPALKALAEHFNACGRNLWFVGGCVRDTLLGLEPKDIDLCTDANPYEQIALYESHKVNMCSTKYFETGIEHGTITVKLGDELYEITSLRTESEHDGRRATVAYTRSLEDDLSRRDLTINAMAQDMEGNIIDPFNGREDLENNHVRFVGNAEERMREDYLRILRFFRFHGRFGNTFFTDDGAIEAIVETKEGLNSISGERIWMELSKIFVGPNAMYIIRKMQMLGVLAACGAPRLNTLWAMEIGDGRLKRPATILGVLINTEEALQEVFNRWKLSNNERLEARYAFKNTTVKSLREYKHHLVLGYNIEHVEEMLKLHNLPSLRKWDIPTCPIGGADLIALGIKPGPELGKTLTRLFDEWTASRYTLKKEELLQLI